MIYDKKYYLRHLAYSGTPAEIQLTSFRSSLVRRALDDFEGDIGARDVQLLDYGCSHGVFLAKVSSDRSLKFDPTKVVGVDVNTYSVAHAVKHGLKAFSPEMFEEMYFPVRPAVVTFWDSLENLRDPREVITDLQFPDYICASLPCLDGFHDTYGRFADVQKWKHHRPLEHLWSFSVSAFTYFAETMGYDPVYLTFDESLIRVDKRLGEKNIMSFVLKKRN